MLLGTLCVGCGRGDSGPPRFDVRGTVTHDSIPVPYGSIRFVPDAFKGNDGPMGYATIIDGKFDTAANGKGVVQEGPYEVLIAGFRGPRQESANPDEVVPDNSLFPEFRTTVELSAKSGKQDFVVPVTAKN